MNFKSVGSDGGKDGPMPPSLPALALARQLSVYSLTLDELQSTLGAPTKDYGSMNMDEFLRNIWTAEEGQAMASVTGATAESSVAGAGGGASSGLQRQVSLSLPRTLSQKTVDEVWRDLLRDSDAQGSAELQQPHRQPTLGEMTLEEFLVRAGVVREDVNRQVAQRPMAAGGNSSIFFGGELPNSNGNNAGLTLGFADAASRNAAGMNLGTAMRTYPAPLQVSSNVEIGNHQGMRAGGIVGIGDPRMKNALMSGVMGLGGGGPVAAVGSPDGLGKGNGDLSSLSPVPYLFVGGTRGRRSGAVEKVVERRQRRMIKNRESAARSRARKQAYTMELEAEVAKLKEQNQELERKQTEILELQRNQVMEMMNLQRGTKKLCLRRTQTGPW